MFRKFRRALREAGLSRIKRPRWKFRPSMGQLLTELEDRQLLSGVVAEQRHVAAQAHFSSTVKPSQVTNVDPNSPAALYVTAEYDSILLRSPSESELDYWVGRLQKGMSTKSFDNTLLYSSERQSLLINLGVDLYGSSTSFVDSLYTKIALRSHSAGRCVVAESDARRAGPASRSPRSLSKPQI